MNEEFRRLQLQQKIAAHFRNQRKRQRKDQGTAEDRLGDATEIMLAHRWALRRRWAWKPDEELVRIREISLSLNRVIGEIRALPEPLRIALTLDSARTDAAPKGIITALKEIREAIQPGIKSAKQEAKRGIATDERHTDTDGARAGAVLNACRIVWGRRIGVKEKVPPTVNAGKPGPFHKYVADVFETLGIETPVRTAVTANESWRERRLLHKTADKL